MDTYPEWTLFFRALTAIAACVGAVGIYYAARTFRYAAKTFRFNTWLKAQAIYVEDKEFYDARTYVLNKFGFDKNNPPTFNSETEREYALLVCRKMDELARLIPYVKREKIIETWGVPMGKSWMILENFIIDEINREAPHIMKWTPFEDLCKEAVEKYNLRDWNEQQYQEKQKKNQGEQ